MKQLKAAVFDWAGTLIDFSSQAPMGVFVETFRRFGVEVSVEEARQPMGRPKWDHIAAMFEQPRIASAWRAAHGRSHERADIDAVYDVFLPMNEAVIGDHSELIPGAADVVAELRRRGLKIGSTTGYTRSIMERVLPLVEQQGLVVDNLVCAGDLPEGRPSPMNMYRTFLDLGVWPASQVVKVDDTPVGIAEGVNAGCWTVGVTLSGNEAGLTLDEFRALSAPEKQELREQAGRALAAEGADFLIDTVAGLVPVIDEINRRLAGKG